jgi:hypothetical protein
MAEPEKPDEIIDWRLTTWDGAQREQLRRWADLPLEAVIQALEEMEQLAKRLSSQADAPEFPIHSR